MQLFHYTSINTLALILESKKIRFGRLDKVNDPMEGNSQDFHSLAPYIFISCWTESKEEDLALWNMYTPNMRGVRIGVELPIFNSHDIRDMKDFLFEEKDLINEELGYFILGGTNIPHRIEYSDSEERLKPFIRTKTGVNLERLGKFKRKMWSMENEYRYRMEIIPIDKNLKDKDLIERYMHLIDSQTPPPLESFFVEMEVNAFKGMSITCGPRLKPGDWEIVNALVSRYNPSARVYQSSLQGFVR